MTQEQIISNLMQKLSCTREEALDIIATDKAINSGADPFPLDSEQKKVVQKMLRTTGTRKTKNPTVYKFESGRQVKPIPKKKQSSQSLRSCSMKAIRMITQMLR